MDNKQKSREYWEKRARENENKVYKKAGDLKKDLDEHYIKARREIQKFINDLVARYMDKTELSYVDAMKNLTSSEFKEWKMTLEEYEKEISRLFKAGEEELANKLRIELETLAMKSRITRLDSLKTQIDIELNRKVSRDYDVVKKGISDVYRDFYTITTSDFGLTGVNTVLPDKVLKRLINQPWSGANFSERIWGNTETLGKVLKQEIIQSFIQGISVKDLSDRIQNRFETDRKNTERLVRTELNHALNETTKLSYEEAEIDEYEYLAEIDGRTSDICRELNGQKFKMKDAKVGVNYPPMHPNCFDQETEIYTNKGWKFFKDLDKSELVYTVNPDTLNVEWQKPINYISYKYKGKMFYYENSRFNLMITPQHKILVQNMDNTVKNKSWKLKEAVKVGRKSKNRMLSGINWQGKTKDFEFLAGEKVKIELYLKFMAYWLADGSCTKDRGSYNIKIAQCENDWMYEELKEIPFKIYKCKESLMIHNKELGNELSKFGKCTEKYIPENIKELNPELIRIFLMAYAKTDGHIRKGKNWKGYKFNDSIVFFTTSDKMASDLGELILKAGGRPSYYLNKIQGKEIEFRNGRYRINKDCWVISWNTQIHTWISNLNISEVDYNDNVYCVEVLKYNTVLVRRNGKVCWSGNCRSTTVPVIDYENFGKKKESDIQEKKKNKKDDIIKEKDELYGLNNKSPRKKFAEKLLSNLELNHLEVNVKEMSARGSCGLGFEPINSQKSKLIVKTYNLEKGDNRKKCYQLKTVFHEAYHALGHNKEVDFVSPEYHFQDWAYMDDVFAECSAHYMMKRMGNKIPIAPSYPDYLVKTLPKLKKLEKFKNCKTIEDFGEIAWKDKLTGKNPSWITLKKELDKVNVDEEYYKKYLDYAKNNKSKIHTLIKRNSPSTNIKQIERGVERALNNGKADDRISQLIIANVMKLKGVM